MARHSKTQAIIDAARAVLSEYHPQTVRQVYYRLVAAHVIDNTRSQYKAVSRVLVGARQEGLILWEWVEDRLRRPRAVPMWSDVEDLLEDARRAYRRDVWATQAELTEVWLEKDALSAIFADALEPYGVTLNVGRGYDSWSSIRNAAMRYERWGGPVTVLYFGDFDPSGRDMVRSLRERLAFFGTSPEISPEIEIVAILREDIERYDLPPDFTKAGDSRRASFVAEHGDVAVELDALPLDVLTERIEGAVREQLDLEALSEVWEQEERDRGRLAALMDGAAEAVLRR